ncbi:MAG: hypothetical protein U5J62_09010 [Desulfurivibrio sp.]|nr:hypothetical protein [Desulfurivibrio sp.]
MGLHTWGHNLEGKVFFDHFGIREAAGSGSGGYYDGDPITPIQQ